MKTIEIIIVDDHQIFLEGIASLLDDVPSIRIVGTALNGEEALDLLQCNVVDLVVCDISMPEMNGLDLSIEIKKKYPKIGILILSSHSDIQLITKGIKNDVDGYLLKNTEKEELVRAIETIKHGENYFSSHVKEVYMKNAFERKKLITGQPQLSKREIEILRLIAEEYTTQEISEKICISQNTVNTHRRNLLTKLNVKNTAGLVKFAVQNHLLDNEDSGY